MSFTEIYKCLRDGLASSDASYKHLCLEIILQHLVFMVEDEAKHKTLTIHKELAKSIILLQEYNDSLNAPTTFTLPKKVVVSKKNTTSLSSKEPQGKDSSS